MPIDFLLMHLGITLLVFLVGWLLHYFIGMGSVKRRKFCTAVWWWATVSYFVSPLFASSFSVDNDDGFRILAMGSLLLGILIGIVHGTIAVIVFGFAKSTEQ